MSNVYLYSMRIRQRQPIKGAPVKDVPQYLIDHCNNIGTICSFNLVQSPRQKAHREMPDPGIIWLNGVIEFNTTACANDLQRNINKEGFMHIAFFRK